MESHNLFKKNKSFTEDLLNFNLNKWHWLFCENYIEIYLKNKNYLNEENKVFTSVEELFQEDYFTAQQNAFVWGLSALSSLENGISWPFINKIHILSTEKLHHEEGEDILHKIRDIYTYIAFTSKSHQKLNNMPPKASLQGIKELEIPFKDFNQELIYYLSSFTDNKKQIINAETAMKILEKQDQAYEIHINEIQHILDKHKINFALNFKDHKNRSKDYLDAFNEIASIAPEFFNRYISYCLPNNSAVDIREKAEKLIADYNEKIKNLNAQKNNHNNDEKIIKAIIIFIKTLLNLHVKGDGNGRLCAHQLLNLLLIQNGFPPCLLENNCLDAFTIDELYEKIKIGIQKFKSYGKSKNEALNPKAQTMKEYLNKIDKLNTKRGELEINISESDKAKKIYISSYQKYILNNDTFSLRSEMEKMESFSLEDLHFFLSYKYADIEMILPIIKKNIFPTGKHTISSNMEDIIFTLVEGALDQANTHLLKTIIFYCRDYQIELEEMCTVDIISRSNLEVVDLLEIDEKNPILKKTLIDKFIFINDPGVAVKILAIIKDNVMSSLDIAAKNFSNETEETVELIYSFANGIFTYHSSKVIEKFIDIWLECQAPFKINEMTLKKDSNCKNELMDIIHKRFDLTNEEKLSILHKMDPKQELDILYPFNNTTNKLNF